MGVKGNLAVWEAETEGLELQADLTIGRLLDDQAKAQPDKEGLVYNYPELGIEMRLTFQQYRAEVDRLAKSLIALDIHKGDHVAIWASNVPQWVLLQLATARIGAILVTVNTAYRTSELEYVLRQGDVKALFMIEEFRGNSYLEAVYNIVPEIKNLGDPATESLQSSTLPRLKRVVLIGHTPRPGVLLYDDLLEMGQTVTDEKLETYKAAVTARDTAMILYTSGTTGFPKGAMLSHYNIINTMLMNIRGQDYSNERYINPMPLFHVAGCNFNIFSIIQGVTNIPVIAFDPAKVLELFVKERGTMAFAVPTMLLAMLNHPRFLSGELKPGPIRLIYTGGTTIPASVMEAVKLKLGSDVGILFGQTESTGAGTGTLPADSFELKSTTVGKAYANMEIKIVNPETGQPVECDQSGELWMRGFPVMTGYYNMPEKTAETIDPEGWLHSGDLATMDAQGYIKIIGRAKDMIIRGGENVYPAEIEAFLSRHPAIADAQVIGVPDDTMGEEIAVLIKLRPNQVLTEDALRDHCRANISRYKVPRYVRFVTDYPLTSSGKVKKFELKQQFLAELERI